MQDRYAGDVGDFLKYGLLRQLTAATRDDSPLTLGVAWYRTPDESHNDDGKHVSYLQPGNPVGESLRRLDPDLHDRMRHVVASQRSVAAVEQSGALPATTRYHPATLTFNDMSPSDRDGRLARRRSWLNEALRATAGCDVVFADPDNGIRRTDHRTGRHRRGSEKHVYIDELAELAQRGQAIVVYHHADRSAPVQTQIERRLHDLQSGGMSPIAAVRASRGTTRLFLIAGNNPTGSRLRLRLQLLEQSPWHEELSVTWPQRNSAQPSWEPPRAIDRRG